jgi:hypothetical protein
MSEGQSWKGTDGRRLSTKEPPSILEAEAIKDGTLASLPRNAKMLRQVSSTRSFAIRDAVIELG